jgi:hypothetical protein
MSPAIGCTELFLAENRLTSIQASHPIEIGSTWREQEMWCSFELKKKAISSFMNFGPP